MGGNEERLKRPGAREETVAGVRKKSRLPIPMAPAQRITVDDTRSPTRIADEIVAWCKRNLKKNEKIHREDLWRAIRLTDEEKAKWGNVTVHLKRVPDGIRPVVFGAKGYWMRMDSEAQEDRTSTKRVEDLTPGVDYIGQVAVDGILISYVSATFQMDQNPLSEEPTLTGIKIVVDNSQAEGIGKLIDLYETIPEDFTGNNQRYKREIIHRMITNGRVRSSRLVGAWISTVNPYDVTLTEGGQTEFTISYDMAVNL